MGHHAAVSVFVEVHYFKDVLWCMVYGVVVVWCGYFFRLFFGHNRGVYRTTRCHKDTSH